MSRKDCWPMAPVVARCADFRLLAVRRTQRPPLPIRRRRPTPAMNMAAVRTAERSRSGATKTITSNSQSITTSVRRPYSSSGRTRSRRRRSPPRRCCSASANQCSASICSRCRWMASRRARHRVSSAAMTSSAKCRSSRARSARKSAAHPTPATLRSSPTATHTNLSLPQAATGAHAPVGGRLVSESPRSPRACSAIASKRETSSGCSAATSVFSPGSVSTLYNSGFSTLRCS